MSLRVIEGRGSQGDPYRRALLAKLHIGKKEIGYDEDSYRDLIRHISDGRTCTAAHLMNREIEEILGFWRQKLDWHGKQAESEREARRLRSLKKDLVHRAVMTWGQDGGWEERLDGLCLKLIGVASHKWIAAADQAIKVLSVVGKIKCRLKKNSGGERR